MQLGWECGMMGASYQILDCSSCFSGGRDVPNERERRAGETMMWWGLKVALRVAHFGLLSCRSAGAGQMRKCELVNTDC
jgi:hypothetical protein